LAGLDASVEGGSSNDPYVGLPSLDVGEPLTFMVGRRVGFSADDRYLGFEISTCDPCPAQFHFKGNGVKSIDFAYFYDPPLPEDERERRQKKHDADVEKKLAELGPAKAEDGRILRGPFPYPDLTFASKTWRDERTGKVTLLFGARVGTRAPVYPIRIELGPHPMFKPPKEVVDGFAKLTPAERAEELRQWQDGFKMYDPVLAYANVTKDGKDIGVVAIAGGNMWYEAGDVARMPVRKFVAHVRGETRIEPDGG
jgi:hypothetical protein